MIRYSLVLAVCVFTAAGCASTQEIETSRPQPRTTAPTDDRTSVAEAPLAIVLSAGETALPADVSTLRFRITEVRLRRADGTWVRLPSDAAPVEIGRGAERSGRTLIDTRITPARYDSLAIAFADVFVQFGENAGGSLTTGDVPQTLALELDPSLDEVTNVMLALEPGASLTRSPDCRWFFVPVLRSDVRTMPR